MKHSVQTTGMGVTVVFVGVLSLCTPGVAGSESDLPADWFVPSVKAQTLRHNETAAGYGTAITRLRSRKPNKKRLAAAVYIWYALTRKRPI